jgi:WD40 repeat protein
MVAVGSCASEQPAAVRLWTLSAGWPPRPARAPAQVLPTRYHGFQQLAFSPDGRKLVTSYSYDHYGSLELWEVGTVPRSKSIDLGPRIVMALAFRPDGKQIAAACDDGVVELRDPTTGDVARASGAPG